MVDKINIQVKAGDGGDGAVSFRKERHVANAGPEGGDGGKGGEVYLEASTDVRDFEHLRYKGIYLGSNGEKGGKKGMNGKNGEDLVIKIPVGSMGKFGLAEFDLKEPGERLLVARGGNGGIGNKRYWRLKVKRTRVKPQGFWDRREMMKEASSGEAGEEVEVSLELRLIADVGIVGFPNAGKSSLLSKLTKATPKIANYPFTTLEPNIGILEFGGKKVALADIPGLVEGAGVGKGIGFDFLRHVSRTSLLLFIFALSEYESKPKEAFKRLMTEYKVLEKELGSYDPELLKRKRIVLLNKVDLVDSAFVKTLLTMFSRHKIKVLGVSALSGAGLSKVRDAIVSELGK